MCDNHVSNSALHSYFQFSTSSHRHSQILLFLPIPSSYHCNVSIQINNIRTMIATSLVHHTTIPLTFISAIGIQQLHPSVSRFKSQTSLHIHSVHCCAASTPPSNTKAGLVTAKDLLHRIHSNEIDPPTIIDVRGRVVKPHGRVESGKQLVEYVTDDNAYFGNHIPGASFVDWQSINISNHVDLCDMLSQRGVERHQPIIIYDWGDMLFSTRLWYALVAMGCEQVSIVDGGWTAWNRIDGPVSVDTACPLTMYSEFESNFDIDKIPPQTITLEAMKLIFADRSKTNSECLPLLIDARSQQQFTGKEQRAKFGGHIPTAKNIPYRWLLNDDGIGLRSNKEIVSILKKACDVDDISSIQNIISYCNGGVASTLILFCLVRNGMDLKHARNYCSGFSQWGNLEDVLIEADIRS